MWYLSTCFPHQGENKISVPVQGALSATAGIHVTSFSSIYTEVTVSFNINSSSNIINMTEREFFSAQLATLNNIITFIGHRVRDTQGYSVNGWVKFFLPDFNKLPYSLRSQGDKLFNSPSTISFFIWETRLTDSSLKY